MYMSVMICALFFAQIAPIRQWMENPKESFIMIRTLPPAAFLLARFAADLASCASLQLPLTGITTGAEENER